MGILPRCLVTRSFWEERGWRFPACPAGVALFGEVRYDVVTDGDFIEKGTPVVIVKIGTNSLVVSKLED